MRGERKKGCEMNGKGALTIPRHLQFAIERTHSKGFLVDLLCDIAKKEIGEGATCEEVANWIDCQSIPVYFARDEKPRGSVIRQLKIQIKASEAYRQSMAT